MFHYSAFGVDYTAFGLTDAMMIFLYWLWALYLCFVLLKQGKYYFNLFLCLSVIHFVTTVFYLLYAVGDSLEYFGTSFLAFKLKAPALGQGGLFVYYYTYFLIHYLKLSYTGCFFFCSAFGLTAYYLMIRTLLFATRKYGLLYNKYYFLFLLLPGVHYWNVALGKDSIVFFSIVLFLSGVVEKKALCILTGTLVVGFIRSPVIALIIVGTMIGMFLNKNVSLAQKVFILLASCFLLFLSMPFLLERLKLESLQADVINNYIEKGLSARFTSNRSNVDMRDSSPLIRFAGFLFRPFFFDVYSFTTLASSIDNCAWVAMFLVGFSNFRKKLFSMNYSGLYAICFFSFLVPVIAQSISLRNLGIAVRMKTMYFPALFFLFFMSYDFIARRKVQKKIRELNRARPLMQVGGNAGAALPVP